MNHYFIAIKAKGIKPAVLENGDWVLMDKGRDLTQTAKRFAMLQKLLGEEGKVCVMSAPDGNLEDLRVMALYHTNNKPKLAEIVVANAADRESFWTRVERFFPEGRPLQADVALAPHMASMPMDHSPAMHM